MATVNSLWIGDEVSNLEKVCIKSFIDHGLSYNLYVYDENINNLPEGVNIKNANEILNEDKIFTYKSGFNKGSVSGFSNYFRYKLLYQNGGVWVDTDIALLRNKLGFKKPNVFITEEGEPPNGKYASSLMRVKKENPVMEICLKKFKKVDTDHIVHGQTGPDLVTKAIKKLGITNEYKNVQLKSKNKHYPIHWEDSERLFYDDLDISREWRTIHFWNAYISEEGVDKNGSYPKWSIFERLKEKHLDG